MVTLKKLLEFRLRVFNNSKEELSMKKVLSLLPKDGRTKIAQMCFINSKGVLELLYEYSSCRGFIHDRLKVRMGKLREEKKNLSLTPYRSMYMYATHLTKLNEDSFRLIEDFCAKLGYKKPEMLIHELPDKQVMLFKLDMNIFKNLYAVSLMFLILKYPNRTKKAKTLSAFIEGYWLNTNVQDRAKMCVKEWVNIFPKGSVKWSSMYGRAEEDTYHDEGMTELLRGTAKFQPFRDKANEILGGVDSVTEKQNEYKRIIKTVKGSVAGLVFDLKY